MGRILSLKWQRADIIRRKLEALPDAIMDEVRKALAQCGDLVVERAKLLVPKDDHILENSIRWEFAKATDGKFNARIIIGPSGQFLKANGRIPDLARWIEFGTQPQKKGQLVTTLKKRGRVRKRQSLGDHSGMPPRPYLHPAVRQTRKQVRAILAKAVNGALKKVAGK